MTHPTPTIGVFDSGFGGLTVLRALLKELPHARYLFLGDSARLPYGSKSPATVARFAVSAARFLLDHGADLLVIACNTATALALPEIIAAAAPTPVLGVITPGTEAAKALTPNPSTYNLQLTTYNPPTSHLPPPTSNPQPSVLVLATPATVASAAYTASLRAVGLHAYEKACPLLVPLVEEGWIDHPVTAEVARIYLAEALAEAPNAQTLLLGCTHYPLIAPLLHRTATDLLGRPIHLVDSARATAEAARTLLGPEPLVATPTPPGSLHIFATDSVDKFQRLGSSFLGRPLPPVHLVDLGA